MLKYSEDYFVLSLGYVGPDVGSYATRAKFEKEKNKALRQHPLYRQRFNWDECNAVESAAEQTSKDIGWNVEVCEACSIGF